MRRDAIFYRLFQRSPSLLFEFVESPPPQAQDYRFESVEIKEPSFRIDGVFLPPDTSPVFFAEVQFQKDEALYHRMFSEIFLYLYRNQQLYEDWVAVVVFGSRNLEPTQTTLHRSLLNSTQVQRVYLDEIECPDTQPLGIQLMLLTIAPDDQAIEQARRLIAREETADLSREAIIEIATTIVVYKFTNLSRDEVETMLGIGLEETRFFQEVKEEGREEGRLVAKLELVPRMLERGMSREEIAELLGLTLEQVTQTSQPPS